MKENFKTYLQGVLSIYAYDKGLRKIFVSPHRRTKIINDPGMIEHAELLELADLLDVSPLFLIEEFQAATSLTDREKENLRTLELMADEMRVVIGLPK